jgi:hypothetical protein
VTRLDGQVEAAELVTVASESAGHFDKFLASCKRIGITPRILGWGMPFPGYGYRLKVVYERLCRVQGRNRVVLFSDAFDSVVLAPLETIVERFLELECPIVMSAERVCWPNPAKATAYPPAPTPYRFLCAGGWIAFADAMRELLETVSVADLPSDINDQAVFTDIFLTGASRIRLDYGCAVFQCLYAAEGDLDLLDGVRNTVTGSRPLVIHGNGLSDLSRVFQSLGL